MAKRFATLSMADERLGLENVISDFNAKTIERAQCLKDIFLKVQSMFRDIQKLICTEISSL